MIKLVVFDWNGTLFADTYAIVYGVDAVFKLLGLKPPSLRQIQNHYDTPVTKTYLGLGAPKELLGKKSKEIAHAFHSTYEPRAKHIRSRAHAKALLKFLRKEKIETIIVSNHIDEPIRKQLRRLKMEKYFSTILANIELSSSLYGRNKLEKVKKHMREKKILGNETIVVGDTLEEIEIGKELNATTVAITHGNCSTKRLKMARPDYVINSLLEVIKIVQSL